MKIKNYINELGDEGLCSLELRGCQSVRTTFKISERCIEALRILAAQMGIKQKSLFDQLIDDTQALKAIAKTYDDSEISSHRVAKTYVISRKTLESLEYVSRRYNTPRDVLVEFSIERILPLIVQEKRKYVLRKEVAARLGGQLAQGRQLLQWATEELGEDDPVVEDLRLIIRTSDLGLHRMLRFLEKGKKIEQF